MDFGNAVAWIQFGQQLVSAGVNAVHQVKDAASRQGIEMDTELLDSLIEDAKRRQAIAEAESQATS